MSYATEHASALADIRAAGVDVTFTLTTSTYTEATDVESAPVETTVSGAAIRVKGNPNEYAAMKLTQAGLVTLLFAPDTYGERPALSSVVEWEGSDYTVVGVSPTAPDGVDIISRVVIA